MQYEGRRVAPELFCDIVDWRRWRVPLLLTVLADIARHGESKSLGHAPHLPGQGTRLTPRHPAAGTQDGQQPVFRLKEFLGLPTIWLTYSCSLRRFFFTSHHESSGIEDT